MRYGQPWTDMFRGQELEVAAAASSSKDSLAAASSSKDSLAAASSSKDSLAVAEGAAGGAAPRGVRALEHDLLSKVRPGGRGQPQPAAGRLSGDVLPQECVQRSPYVVMGA